MLAALFLLPRAGLLLFDIAPSSDAAWYFSRAQLLAQGKGYIDVTGIETAFWPPGWPMAMAAIFKIFGVSLVSVGVFNLVFSAVTAVFVLRVTPRIFRAAGAGRVAVLLLALYPNNALYVPLALTEVFYTALMCFAIWALIEGKGLAAHIIAGLFWGFAILVKTQTLLLLAMVLLLDLARVYSKSSGAYRQVLWRACVVTVISAAVVLPWSIRNYRIFGEWVTVSTNGGYSLLVGNNPNVWAPKPVLDATIKQFNEDKRRVGELPYDQHARAKALEWIKENPEEFILLAPIKFARLWVPDGEAVWAYEMGMDNWTTARPYFLGVRLLNQAWYFGLLSLAIIAGGAWSRQRRRDGLSLFGWWMLPYVLACHATITCLIFSGQTRYHYPVMPWLCMAGGWWLAQRIEAWVSRQRQAIEQAG